MNIVIVPSHNQSEHIEKIISGYNKQTVKPDLILFVFDRCSDDSRQVFLRTKSNVEKRCLVKSVGNNFSAGMTRDFGLEYIQKEYPNYNSVIFTDGDCIPCERLVELHVDCLSNSNKAAVSCGRRVMKQRDGTIREDERIENKWTNDYAFTEQNARLLVSKRVTLDSIFTYSCNFAFNKSAINLIQKINKQISGVERLFNPEFDGSWGGEDNFISDCLFRTNNDILLTSKECYVEHQWHIESDKSNIQKKREIVKRLTDALKNFIITEQLPGDYTVFQRNRNIFLPKKFDYQEISNLKTTVKEEDFSSLKFVLNQKTPDEQLVLKYYLSRNYKIINSTEDNGMRKLPYEKIDELLDYITSIRVYLKNGQVEIDDSHYKPRELINNFTRI